MVVIIAGNQIYLMIQVKEGIVDRSGCHKDQLFTQSGTQNTFQIFVPCDNRISEIMALVHKHNFHILITLNREVLLSKFLLGMYIGLNVGVIEFGSPHIAKLCRTYYHGPLSLVVGVMLQYFFTHVGFT